MSLCCPDLISQEKLIGQVELDSAVITPNGDGIHDGCEDVSGRTVAPGSYVYRISLGTDAGNDERMSTIAVAY